MTAIAPPWRGTETVFVVPPKVLGSRRGPSVALCVGASNASALGALRSAIVGIGLDVIEVAPVDLLGDDGPARTCELVISDLSPSDQTTLDGFRGVRAAFPELPILLFVKPGPGIGPVLSKVLQLGAIHLEFQLGESGERVRLQSAIRTLIEAAPAMRLRRLVESLIEQRTRRLGGIFQLVADRLRSEGGMASVSVVQIAGYYGMSVRRLEQLCKVSDLPAPRSLISYIALLWFSATAQQRRGSTATIARHASISSSQLYRLRRRALGHVPSAVYRDSGLEVDALLKAFVERCRIPMDIASWIGETQRRRA